MTVIVWRHGKIGSVSIGVRKISDTSGSKALEKRVAAFLDEFFDFMAIEKKYLLSLHDAHERFIIDLTGLSFDELVSLSSSRPES